MLSVFSTRHRVAVSQPCRGRRSAVTVVSSTISSGKSASYVTQTLVDPSPITGKPPAGQAASSIPVPLVAGIFALAGAAAVAYKKIRDNQGGSTGGGFWGHKDDYFLKEVMRDVNTTRIDGLTKEQIMAARARRSKERANVPLTMDEVELPENHPWATRKPVSQEEAAAAAQRLQLRSTRRRGVPPGDAMGAAAGQQGGRSQRISRVPPENGSQ